MLQSALWTLSDSRSECADNVIDFVVSENLDGVDFDWEYPGAPDSQGEGIPVDGPERALEYLELPNFVRAGLSSGLTIEIAKVIGYVIYMMYNLNGQWDFGNTFTSPGRPNGNCLRSHINQTETETSLSMVTKAGVPADKIYLGSALKNITSKKLGTYLSATRQSLGGISDWAIDLDITGSRDGAGDGGGSGNGNDTGTGEVVYIDPSLYEDANPTASCRPPCTFVFPPWTLPYTTTISPAPITSTVLNRWTDVVTSQAPGGVTAVETLTFETSTVTVISIPPITTTEIDIWNYVWTDTDQSVVTLTSSIQFPPIVLTQDPTSYTASDSSEQTTILGATYTVLPGPYPSITADGPVTSPSTGPSTGPSTTQTTASTRTVGPYPPDQTTGPPPDDCDNCPPTINIENGESGPICEGDDCGELCEFGCGGIIPCFPPSGTCNCIGGACPSFPCFGLGCIDFPPGTFPPPGTNLPGGPPPDGPPPNDPSEPTSCSSSTTVTDCSIDCNVELDGRTLSTSCYSTTCSDNVGCNVYPSTTTSETISACPIRATYEATFAPGQIPILGEGGYAGSVVAQGTLSNPGGTATRTSTSTRSSSSSGGATTPTRTATSTSTSADPSYISCSTQNQQPGQGITRAYCVCSGSTFAQSTATDPPNSCAYTSLPGSSQTISISRLPTGPTNTQQPQPTSEPEPDPEPDPEPEETFEMCISLSVTPSSQFPVYNYIAFPLDGGCEFGTFIADPNIGSSPGFCSISREETVLDYCDTRARFVDEGQEYRETGCALSVEIDGRVYSDYDALDAGDSEGNPCSGPCGDAFLSGLMVFTGLPLCTV